MEDKKENKKETKKPKQKKKLKIRRKLSQQQWIKLISIILLVVFVGGIFGGALASVLFKNQGNNVSNFNQIEAKDQLVKAADEYEAKIKKDPKDADALYNLVEIYSQLGYYERSKDNENEAVSNFLKAVDYAAQLKSANPSMATSAEYLRAGYLAEAGKLDEAKAIYESVIAGKTDPLISRIVYADFLKSKMKDQAASSAQVQAAKDAAITDKEKEYVESLLKQYNLN